MHRARHALLESPLLMAFAAAALLGGCATMHGNSPVATAKPAAQETPAQAEAIPFRMTSVDSWYAVQGTFEGRLTFEPKALRIEITAASLQLSKDHPSGDSDAIGTVQFGLGFLKEKPGEWGVSDLQTPWQVNKTVKRGEVLPLQPTTFTIPIAGAKELSGRFLVARINDAVGASGDSSTAGYTFVLSDADVFAPLENEIAAVATFANGPATPAGRSGPFHITSVGSDFAVQCVADGRFTTGEQALQLDLSSLRVVVSKDPGALNTRNVLSVRVGLATQVGEDWDVAFWSAPVPVNKRLNAGEAIELGPVKLVIPTGRPVKLTGHWLTVEMSEGVSLPEGPALAGTSYAHSSQDIFAGL